MASAPVLQGAFQSLTNRVQSKGVRLQGLHGLSWEDSELSFLGTQDHTVDWNIGATVGFTTGVVLATALTNLRGTAGKETSIVILHRLGDYTRIGNYARLLCYLKVLIN